MGHVVKGTPCFRCDLQKNLPDRTSPGLKPISHSLGRPRCLCYQSPLNEISDVKVSKVSAAFIFTGPRIRAERRGRCYLIFFFFQISLCLLSTYSTPSTVLGAGDAQVNRTRQVPSHEVFSFGRWACVRLGAWEANP